MMLELGTIVRPYPGERCSGDATVVRRGDAVVMFGVIDALGHGEAAAEAANAAVAHLESVSLRDSIGVIFGTLDVHLRGGRGAAALVCVARGDALEGCGVGNVELRSVGMRVPVLGTPGILGRGPTVRPRVFTTRLISGARLVLFSDGVSGRLRPDHRRELAAQAASAALLAQWGRDTDDAAVLVADVTG